MADGVGPGRKLAIWVGVSVLYVAMYAPALFLLRLGRVDTLPLPWVGVAVMALGLGLEAAADAQKSRFKATHPNDFCNVGLYRLVRCPNYLGEIVFWTGNLLAGIVGMHLWWHWLAALAGYACIVLIMMGSTKRLEQKQDERYGDRPDYHDYVEGVPVLFPFVPLYTLKNLRVYLE
jgi:steroid 5-alpha reductase family enzyme